jgi:protein involved in polysaccharide export with SLBB domain
VTFRPQIQALIICSFILLSSCSVKKGQVDSTDDQPSADSIPVELASDQADGNSQANLNAPTSTNHYLVRCFDRFLLQVTGFPEFSIEGVVRPDGRISIPQMGEFIVVGRSIPEVRTAIADSIGNLITLPLTVDFLITEVAEYPVYIFGEVGRPGVFQNRQNVSLLQAIAMAGGLERSSETKQIIIMRQQPDAMIKLLVINLEQLISGEVQSDIILAPFDVVFVPKTFITNINDFIDQYVVGVIPPVDIFIRDRYYWELGTRRIVE